LVSLAFTILAKRLVMLTSPPFLELGWREIAQRGVDALVQVDVVQEPAQLADRLIGFRVCVAARQE
jgi:hypothetical protein